MIHIPLFAEIKQATQLPKAAERGETHHSTQQNQTSIARYPKATICGTSVKK
jgi:hypothetical protein